MHRSSQRAPAPLFTSSARWALVFVLSACSSEPREPNDDEPAKERDAAVRADSGTTGAATRADGGARDASAPIDARVQAVDASQPRDAAIVDRTDAQPDAELPAGNTGDAAVGTGTRLPTARLDAPPMYMGTNGGSDACTKSFRTFGFAPVDTSAAKHPLFLYFAGTAGGSADESSRYDNQAAARVTEALAQRGFVALSAEYDNALLSILTNKPPCLFDKSKAESLIAKACALPDVDCSLGIATWGHSQGALLAHVAANFDARVRAVWTTGYSGLTGAKLPSDRFRTVNGEGDVMNAAVATANRTAGFSADQCPDDGRESCLRPDGSGWIVVRKVACQLNSADHCWFNKRSCGENVETLEPSWSDARSDKLFALEESADWVAKTTARP